MLAKIIRISGITLIIIFSVISIFFSMSEREISESKIKNIMAYSSLFEDRFYDFRMSKTLEPTKIDERLVLAKIDDKALQEIGRWPWPRTVWAKFIRKMNKFDARILAFDVFFSEPELACNQESPDLDMARAIIEFQQKEKNKVILPYSLNTLDSEQFTEIPAPLYNFVMNTKQAEGLQLIENTISKAVFPIEPLTESEAALGHIQAVEDVDGIFRHYPVAANVDSLYFPSFALLIYQYFTGEQPTLELLNLGEASLNTKRGNLHLNYRGESKIRWLGGPENFPQISIFDILQAKDNDKKMKELFAGKIIFIGSTAFGAHDLRHTPVDAMLPGIYSHINMTHMLLEGKFFRPKDKSTLISWLILIIGTILMVGVQFFRNAIIDLCTVIFLTLGLYFIDTYYLIPLGYETKLFFCLFSVVACYSWSTFLNFYLTSKDKMFLKNAFGSYISPELIDMMYKSGEPPKLGGEVGPRTAFFTDIQGFSTFSEKLNAPKLVELLNEYLTCMTDILLAEGGTLDKYEGDAIIAFFGAPMPLTDHAIRACRVALKMQDALIALRQKWANEGDKWPPIVHQMRMRIGINSGEIVTGNMGSRSRMNYTMMGDSVNLAARLEAAAKQYGIFTQVSEFTKELVDEFFIMRKLDTVKVVGKDQPVTTYDLLGERDNTHQDLLCLQMVFHQGIELYLAQKWDEAIEKFKEAVEYEHKRYPELVGKNNPSLIYIKRCQNFKELPPPPDWNGVYTLTEK